MARLRVRSQASRSLLAKLAGVLMLCVVPGFVVSVRDGSEKSPWDTPVDGTSPIHNKDLWKGSITSKEFFGHSYLVRKTCYAVLGRGSVKEYDPEHGNFAKEIEGWDYVERSGTYFANKSSEGKYISQAGSAVRNNLLLFYHNTKAMERVDGSYDAAAYHAYIHLVSGAFKDGDIVTLVYGPYVTADSEAQRLGIEILPVLDACLALSNVSKGGESFLSAMTGGHERLPVPGTPKYTSMSLIRTFAKVVHAMTNKAYVDYSAEGGEIAFKDGGRSASLSGFEGVKLSDVADIVARWGKDPNYNPEDISRLIPRRFMGGGPITPKAYSAINALYFPYGPTNVYMLNLVDTASDSIVYTANSKVARPCGGSVESAAQLCHKEDDEYAKTMAYSIQNYTGGILARNPDFLEPLHPWYKGTNNEGVVKVPSFRFPVDVNPLRLMPGCRTNIRNQAVFGVIDLDESDILTRGDHRADAIETAYYLLYIRPAYLFTVKVSPSVEPVSKDNSIYGELYGPAAARPAKGYNCLSPHYTGDFTYGEPTAIPWHRSEAEKSPETNIHESGVALSQDGASSVRISAEADESIRRAEMESCDMSYMDIFGRGFIEKLGIISHISDGSFAPEIPENRDSSGAVRLGSKLSSAYTVDDVYDLTGNKVLSQMRPMNYPEWYTSLIHFYLSTAGIPEVYDTKSGEEIVRKLGDYFKYKADGTRVGFKSSPLYTPDVSCRSDFPPVWGSTPREERLDSMGAKMCSPSDPAHPIISGKFTWFGAPLCNVKLSSSDANYLTPYVHSSRLWMRAAVEASKKKKKSSGTHKDTQNDGDEDLSLPCVIKNVSKIPLSGFKGSGSFVFQEYGADAREMCSRQPNRMVRSVDDGEPYIVKEENGITIWSDGRVEDYALYPYELEDIIETYFPNWGPPHDPTLTLDKLFGREPKPPKVEIPEDETPEDETPEDETPEDETPEDKTPGQEEEDVPVPDKRKRGRMDPRVISAYTVGAVATVCALSAGGYAVRRMVSKSRGQGGDESITCDTGSIARDENLDGLCWVESLVYENGEPGFGDPEDPASPDHAEFGRRSVRSQL